VPVFSSITCFFCYTLFFFPLVSCPCLFQTALRLTHVWNALLSPLEGRGGSLRGGASVLLGQTPAPALAMSRATGQGRRASPGSVSSDAPLMLSPALEGPWWASWFATIESQSGLGWKGPAKIIKSNSPAMGGTPSTRPGCSEPRPT